MNPITKVKRIIVAMMLILFLLMAFLAASIFIKLSTRSEKKDSDQVIKASSKVACSKDYFERNFQLGASIDNFKIHNNLIYILTKDKNEQQQLKIINLCDGEISKSFNFKINK